jgi:hypothetical protein
MSEERILYNGVWVSHDWPARIDAAQAITHYVIGSNAISRIRYGEEPDDWGADRQPCHHCGVIKGQFHVGPVCDVERCPGCGGQVISCECDYEDDESRKYPRGT